MKVSKLLVLGTLLVALCMAGQAIAAWIPANCTGNGLIVTISRPAPLVYAGATVEYTVTLENQVFPQCQKTNVYVYFYPPDVAQPVDCRSPGAGAVLLAGPLTLDPGDSHSYNSGNNAALAFPAPASGDFTAFACAFGDAQTRPGGVDLADGDNDITTTVIKPVISITKSADPIAICEGAVDVPITYTYLVSWGVDGDTDMTDVVVTDDKCGSVVRGADDPGNDDAWLESGEVWVFTCSTTVSAETTNVATVNANDILGNPVTPQQDDFTVTVNPAPVVSVDPPSATICEAQLPVQFCAEVEPLTGTPPFTYAWTKTGSATIIGTESCISVSEAGEYCVTVTDDAGCKDDACGTLTVIEAPSCSIDSGPRSICQDDIGIAVQYCSDAVADGYEWDIISGPATIDGADDGQCVSIIPNDLGTIVLGLQIWNDVPGDGVCGDSCQIEILVEECGGTFCTFTQGFWGNAGGKKCDGQSTSALIQAALTANGGSIMVGQAGHSITFNSVECILASLPAGGKPAVLPAGDWTCATLGSSGLNKKNKSELNNVLIGQAVALTLNLLVPEGCVDDSGILADWVLPEEFCTVPYGDEEACAEYSSIPSSLVDGVKDVGDLLAAVNAALAGTGSLSDAYAGATAINEGFDECRTVVPCIRPEICGNGCDDDGDGLTDCCDPDCGCEICDNLIDDDCDGDIDGDDTDCQAQG